MSFDIGWVPEGWVRGNPLGIINNGFRGGPQAAFYYKVQSLIDEIPAIGAVQFHESEFDKARAWFEWWHQPIGEVAA